MRAGRLPPDCPVELAPHACVWGEKQTTVVRKSPHSPPTPAAAPAPGTTRARSAGPGASGAAQQVTVRWNGASAGGAPAAAASRVTTATDLLSPPTTAVAMPAMVVDATVAATAHFEMSSENTTV